jgi:hypothetical protein
MTKVNELVCGDTVYALTPAYIKGARDARDGASHFSNPHRSGSQRHFDWDAGLSNEHAYEHYRFGKDLISEPPSGLTFEEDPVTPRDENHEVDLEWGASQSATAA